MKIVKGILLGLGVLFGALILLGGYAFMSARSSMPQTEAAIESFLAEFTESWDTEKVAPLMTERNLADLRQAQRSGALVQLARLGRHKKSEGVRLVHIHTSPSMTVTVVEMLGYFENGRARLQIAVEDAGGARRIAGFKLLLDGPITHRSTRS